MESLLVYAADLDLLMSLAGAGSRGSGTQSLFIPTPHHPSMPVDGKISSLVSAAPADVLALLAGVGCRGLGEDYPYSVVVKGAEGTPPPSKFIHPDCVSYTIITPCLKFLAMSPKSQLMVVRKAAEPL